ncbi:type II secretion system F family protein [Chloroflexota bacterium]
MEFKYLAESTSGEVVKGVVEADSLQRAEELLWHSNLTIVNLKKQIKLPSLAQALPSLFGVKRGDIINFARDLATMLGAGLPMLRSLDIIYKQTKKRSMKTVVRTIIWDLEKGSSFSEACTVHGNIFPPLFTRLIRVGEEVGSLAFILEQLSTHISKEEETARKVKGSLIYPIFVLGLAVVSVFIMINFVLPAITGLFAEFGSDLPTLARIMIGFGNFATTYMWYIILGLLILIIVLGLYFRTKSGLKVRDTIILKLPVIGEASLKSSLARTARNLAMMVKSGVPLSEALNLVIDTATNAIVKDKLSKCNDSVLEGTPLSQSMAAHPIFPILMSQMVGIGEETGKLEYNLEILAGFYEVESDRAMSRLTGMIGPGMIIIVGLVVAFVAVTLFSSIYSVSSLIK